MWQTAIDIANDRLVKEREALESIKAKAQAETDEAQEAVKTLESEQADLLSSSMTSQQLQRQQSLRPRLLLNVKR